jgi:SAM-dependent methyltransferase
MNFLQQLLTKSRLLTVLFDNLSVDTRSSELYSHVAGYLEKYAAFNHINADTAIDMYTRYITTYNKHCKLFVKTGNYPLAAGITDFTISREEYDLVLILSILFTPHRFRIMQLLQEQSQPAAAALYIGLGSGLEIELTRDRYTEIHAYDLSVNEFLFRQFPGIALNIELYQGQYKDHFDAIYMIELLEHLPDPYELLETCYVSLKKGGKILLTTATDIPQFDHLYNFKADHAGFEAAIQKTGFSIIYKEMIPHHYLAMQMQPCNHFYSIEKV